MSIFIGRLLVLFYIIAIPVFLGFYVTSMVSAHPRYDALWMEGGVTEYGHAAFWVLVAVFVFPFSVSICHYLLSDARSYLKNVLFISLWVAPFPIGCFLVADRARTEFPMAVTMMNDKFVLGAVILVIGVSFSVYSLHDSVSEESEHREAIKALAKQHGVPQRDVMLITDRLAAVFGSRNQYEGRQSYEHYVALHVRNFRALRLSVDDYWSFVSTVVGGKNFFNDVALVELERHLALCAQAGGMDSYLHWLGELKRFGLHDESLGHYFRQDGASGSPKLRLYGRKAEVSSAQCIQEYRIGEFTSVAEYVEFLGAQPSQYMSAEERAKYQAEADRLTHPVLHRMLALGGFYRARALQIARRSMPREVTQARPPQSAAADPVLVVPPPVAIPTASAPPAPPIDPGIVPDFEASSRARPASVMISRRGQVILGDVKLQNLPTLVMQGQVMMTDHYWCQGMPSWCQVSSYYKGADTSRQAPRKGVNWGEVFKDFFLSWLLYILGGVFIAGLLGYGNGGMSGAAFAIGRFLGFIIMVRPVTFVFRTLFRFVIGKRGMALFR